MPLISTNVHIRIRPNDESGEGGHSAKEEERSTKQLHSYTASSVSVSDDHDIIKYDFPSVVFSPQATQEQVYEDVMTDLFASFCPTTKNNNEEDGGGNGNNILLFAYGQTATGKTHTICGSEEWINRCKVPGSLS